MSHAAIDPLRFSNHLEEAGFTDARAEALAQAIEARTNGDARTSAATLTGEVCILK